METKYITTTELAKLLGISRIAVFKKIKSGKIGAKKIGRNFFIDKKNLPGILNVALKETEQKEIEKTVAMAISEYGETLKLLGRE
jgi:excisionase family DNA binding protein